MTGGNRFPASAHDDQPAAVVGRALAKDPAARFPDMNAIVEALAPWAERPPSATQQWVAAPVPAPPAGEAVAPVAPGRRPRWWLVVALVVVAAGVAAALWLVRGP